MRKVKLERSCADCKWRVVIDDDEDGAVQCWRDGEECVEGCAAFRIKDGHVYCLALPNVFVPAFAIGELVEDGAK